MRDAVVEELVAGADEPVPGVHLLEVGLRVDAAGVVSDIGQGGLQQPRGVTVPAGFPPGAQPVEPERLLPAGVYLHQAQGADHLAPRAFEPEVAGFRQQIAAVEFRVGAGLFDYEHLDAELQELVERRGVQVLGPGPVHGHRHGVTAAASTVVSRPNTPEPQPHPSWKSPGPSDNFVPSDGTISFNFGSHDWWRSPKHRSSTSIMAET